MKKNEIKTGHIIGKYYKDYAEAFPFLNRKTFCTLEINGKIGALLRGEKIELPEHDILIEENLYRKEYFKLNRVPMYLKQKP